MRQVLKCVGVCARVCEGGIQYFPSDSASTTNQTQMRNTNTHTVAPRLNCTILELFQAFHPSMAPGHPLTRGGELKRALRLATPPCRTRARRL